MTLDQALLPLRVAKSIGKAWLVVPAALAAVAAGLLLVPLAPAMPASGLDPSWEYAVNEAVARHLVFGRDFIFSYGPFGSVKTWLYHPATDALMLAGSALIAAGLCGGFALLVWPRRIYLMLLLPIVVAEAGSWCVFMEIPFLLLLVVFRLGSARKSPFHLPPTRLRVLGVSVLRRAVGQLALIKGSYAILVVLDGALGLLIDMRPTFFGRLVPTAYKLPRVFIDLRLVDGRVIRRRYIPEMGKAGFVLSPYIGATTDFLMMAAGLTGGDRVRQIRLEAPNYGLWARDITLSLRTLRVPPQRDLQKLAVTEPRSPSAFLSALKAKRAADCWTDRTFAYAGGRFLWVDRVLTGVGSYSKLHLRVF